MGKDTTIGHWEIAGVVSADPLPTYPQGFPREVLEEFETILELGGKILDTRARENPFSRRNFSSERHLRLRTFDHKPKSRLFEIRSKSRRGL